MDVLVPRNTATPAKKAVVLTVRDFRDSVSIELYEGERTLCEYNYLLGEFEVLGVRSASGVVDITVCFDIIANGIWNVSAMDDAGREKEILVTKTGKLSEEEIKKLVQEAKKYKADDEEHNMKVETKNALQNYVYNVRNTFKNETFAAKLPSAKRVEIENNIEQAILWLERNQLAEAEEFEFQMSELESICNPVIAKIEQVADGDIGGTTQEHKELEKEIRNEEQQDEKHKEKMEKKVNQVGKIEKVNQAGKAMGGARQEDKEPEKEKIEKKIKKAISENGEHPKNVEAKNAAENLAYYMSYKIRDVKIALAKAEDAIEQTIQWLERKPLVEEHEFEKRMKELEGLCHPFIAKMYQSSWR